MKLIGAGMGRTGTKSLQIALQELGFDPCYHMTEAFKHPAHMRLWHAAAQGEPIDWDALLGGYEATVDFPGCSFYRELMAHYPDAKVLLSVRDPERWYESAYATIYEMTKVIPRWLRLLVPPLRQLHEMADAVIWGNLGAFEGQMENRALATQKFIEWNERVQRDVPPEKLLVYSVKEGWEPLCDFLGVPVPDKPFPHVNDRAEMMQRIRVIRAVGRIGPVVAGALVVGVLVALWRRFHVNGI